MIANISLGYQDFFALARSQLPFMGKLIAGLWIFNIINWLVFRSRLDLLGIYPRSLLGLAGIIFAPFLHANFNHLFFNTIPLFALGMFILALGRTDFIAISVLIALISGLLVWLLGRKCLHIGASGIIAGYFGFLLSLAYFHPTIISIVLALVTIYYFGSIFAGIIPTSAAISWECHLAGFLAGILVMYCFWFIPGFETQALGLLR
jgi:membrane associated rhomboid family serine protease